jgi:HSP20 family protein
VEKEVLNMANLMRWNPLGDMITWDRNVDELFSAFGEPIEFLEEGSCVCPRVESYRHNGSFVVKVDLPGVNPNDVHLTADQGCLTIEGERKRSEQIEEGARIHGEVCYGSFRRSMAIPEGVKADQIKAKYHDGVLEITAPVEEHSLPKKIEVEVLKS